MKRLHNGELKKDFSTQGNEVHAALQSIVLRTENQDPRFVELNAPPLSVEYPIKTFCFYLGRFQYGDPALIVGCTDSRLHLKVFVFTPF